MRPALLILLLTFCCRAEVRAQSDRPGFTLSGRVVDSLTGSGIEGLEIQLVYQKRIVFTGADGRFAFEGARPGIFTLCIRNALMLDDTLRLFADYDHPVLPAIRRQRPLLPDAADGAIPEITVQTEDADESGPSAGDYAAPTQAGRNPFTDAAAFNLSAFRFQPRSYNRRAQEVSINSQPMQDPASLTTPWNAWSGLNDAFRSRTEHYGIGSADGAFGGLTGSLLFDITAASQRPQSRLGYSLTNRSYRNRVNFTRSTGIRSDRWAFALNGSYRVAKEGFVPGTFYEGASLYAGVSRVISSAHSFHLSLCASLSRIGRSAAVTAETVALSDDPWYNPNWGLQNGRERNARIFGAFQPFVLATHQFTPGSRLRIESSVLIQSGKSGTTGLDYYNAANPRPDYYRYLPSFFAANGRDPAQAAFYTQPQIAWDAIYQQNRMHWDSVVNADGISGRTVAGRRSVYVLYRDVQALRKLAAASNLQWKIRSWLQLNAGVNGVTQSEVRFRELADLLGGDFYLNTNAFIDASANGSLAQYDLRVPDRVIRTGDRYAYDYLARSRELAGWAGFVIAAGRIDMHLESRVQYRSFQREGRFRSGLFPMSSFGAGPWNAFSGASFKGGCSFRLDGRTQLFANALTGTVLPGFDQAFIAPRIRNDTNPEARPDKAESIELGLARRSSKLHLHLLAFATRTHGATELRRYYSDDPAFASFVNYLMTGVAKQYSGIELGFEFKVGPLLTARLALSLTDAFYAADPDAVYIYGDNDTAQVPVRKQVFLKNMALAAGPQTAGTFGLTYRSTKYWYAGCSFNYAARSFVDVNPDRRSETAIQGLSPDDPLRQAILSQERLPAAYTLDLSAGKNWLLSKFSKRVPRNTYMYLNASVSNVLDRRFRTGGYEQLRFDYAGQDPGKFAPKYFYAAGRNFLLSLTIRW